DRKKYGSYTPQQRLNLFRRDIARFQAAVNGHVHVRLYQYEYDALVDFAFNIGAQAFDTSTCVRVLNKRRYKAVPAAMMLFNKPSDVLGRRCDEVRLFRTGRYTDLLT